MRSRRETITVMIIGNRIIGDQESLGRHEIRVVDRTRFTPGRKAVDPQISRI